MYEVIYRKWHSYQVYGEYSTLTAAKSVAKRLANKSRKQIRIERTTDDKYWYVKPDAKKSIKKKLTRRG